MPKQKPKPKPKAKQKPRSDGYPFPNDWLEFVILVMASLGVGGGIFALLYLAHQAGAI